MQAAARRRPTLILIIVLSILLAMMSASSRTKVMGETRTLLARSLLVVVSPIPRAVNAIARFTSDQYHHYLDLRATERENRVLRARVTELTREAVTLRGVDREAARLRALLGRAETTPAPTIVARVVMLDIAGSFKSMILDIGSDDGVDVNDTVLGAEGLAGRVVLTTSHLAKVQLLIDPSSAVGCRIERTRRLAVLHGNGSNTLDLLYVPVLGDVVPGDRIVTAGNDGIYPEDIPVAVVTDVEQGDDLFRKVICRPYAAIDRLEQVLVMKTLQIPSQVERYSP